MKRTILFIAAIIPLLTFSQPRIKNKKYQGLLWEISGNGLKKPSYLFGTMHVSNKLAFHLADSFYVGIRNADVVALETNPESWQEDMSKYDLGENEYGYRMRNSGYALVPNDYLTINALKFYKYDRKIERALHSSPSTINNLLYRSYGNVSNDFEEDTYLDMYIYQCGKKWGKKVAGVERYGESMKLMTEAYKDAAKDKERKERSYDGEGGYSANKLQEAYRSGNLDWLDSINRYNSFSAAFDEKFLYRRNEIQAASIDSILRSGQSLFVGVGAAHLPGGRGVIELLRRNGYKLRAVRMGARDSQHKNLVEKLRVPVVFNTQVADDGAYRVDIPGKFYKSSEEMAINQVQYADMANGSYYMVTRIMTNAWMWGHGSTRVARNIDSLLYENIPGKIISKVPIRRNGYAGFDISNRTRRGDLQRYNIFITPFEIMIFKMSGTGDYVAKGEEANRFFGSIRLREYQPNAIANGWRSYSPKYGGFSIDLPHDPYIGNDGSWIWDAEDASNGAHYRIVRTDIHNYHFAEEDSFDLELLDESFASSDFIQRLISRKHSRYLGYPALDCQYRDKTGGVYTVRFIIKGPHYYTLVAHTAQQGARTARFFESFRFLPLNYGPGTARKDTLLYYSVNSTYFPAEPKEKLDIPGYGDDDEDEEESLADGVYRSKVIRNDSTGERVYVSFYKFRRYARIEDSTAFEKDIQHSLFGDTSWIVRSGRTYTLPGKMKVWESVLTDTGSSRTLWTKTFYKDGIGFKIVSQGDTLSQPSSFIKNFFDSFTPVDTLKGGDPFVKKTNLFFEDFISRDSLVHKRAVKGMYLIRLDSSDLNGMKTCIRSLDWNEKGYLDLKKGLIEKLGSMSSRKTADYLKELYYAAGDTLELQYTILNALLNQQTAYAFNHFREILVSEPPVLNTTTSPSDQLLRYGLGTTATSYLDIIHADDKGGAFFSGLYDSLALTKKILPDLLPLVNLDDYKRPVMVLLGTLVDSGLVSARDYEAYFQKFFLEARQELKKQLIVEKQKKIATAERAKEAKNNSEATDELVDLGNASLELYIKLLMPYWDSKAGVPPLMKQLLTVNDRRLKYQAFMAMLRAKQNYPDTLIRYFAGLDEFRYDLYNDLRQLGWQSRFPSKEISHIDLAKSSLLGTVPSLRPDSLVFLLQLTADFKGEKGIVYYFKYKAKKDDVGWKIASVGPVSTNPVEFTFLTLPDSDEDESIYYGGADRAGTAFTYFSNRRLKEDELIMLQLTKELKRRLYSQRKSAAEFYPTDTNDSDEEEGDSLPTVESDAD